jgi:flavin-binding protein dodecin
MPDSVYKIVELVGTSEVSWEEAAKKAVQAAGRNRSDLRVAEVSKLDLKIEGGQVAAFRARVTVSYRYHVD